MHTLVGIALLVLVFFIAGGFILRAIFRGLKGKIIGQAVGAQASLIEMRPPQIIAAIQAAPLLEQKRAAKAYVGMKVRWRVTFEEVTVSGLMLDLMLQDPASLRPGTPFAWVLCSVHRGKYPQLNGMVQHTPLWVSGQIQSVRDEMITLKTPQLEFEN
jgi:hypothetical protein